MRPEELERRIMYMIMWGAMTGTLYVALRVTLSSAPMLLKIVSWVMPIAALKLLSVMRKEMSTKQTGRNE